MRKKCDPREGVIVNKEDLFRVFDYIMELDERKHWQESGRTKKHIWNTCKRLMLEAGYNWKKYLMIVLFCFITATAQAKDPSDFDVKEVYIKTCAILHYTPSDEKITIQSIKDGQTRYEEATRTIYIRTDQVSEGVLAHEFCHAILANRFVAYPNEFISEMLAQYCEFEVLKTKKNKRLNH